MFNNSLKLPKLFGKNITINISYKQMISFDIFKNTLHLNINLSTVIVSVNNWYLFFTDSAI